MEIKKYEQFGNISESFTMPNIRLEEFLHNISHADKICKTAAASFFTTFEAYIDIIEPVTHLLKVNDLRGDVMNNNRVIIKTYVFSNDDLQTIRTNIVNFCLNEFYNEIPNSIDIFGIMVKPISYINKEQTRQLFDTNITLEMSTRIVADCTKFNYEGTKNNFHFWSYKKQ